MPYKDDLKQHFLVHLQEFLVPLVNVGGFPSRVRLIIGRGWRVGAMMIAPFDDFEQHGLVDLQSTMSITFIPAGTEDRLCLEGLHRLAHREHQLGCASEAWNVRQLDVLHHLR